MEIEEQQRPETLEDLLALIDTENIHPETDTGMAIGNEI